MREWLSHPVRGYPPDSSSLSSPHAAQRTIFDKSPSRMHVGSSFRMVARSKGLKYFFPVFDLARPGLVHSMRWPAGSPLFFRRAGISRLVERLGGGEEGGVDRILCYGASVKISISRWLREEIYLERRASTASWESHLKGRATSPSVTGVSVDDDAVRRAK